VKGSQSIKLPDSWAITRIGEVCANINYGYTASASAEGCGPRFLRITDIQNGQVQWESVPYCTIEPTLIPKYALNVGDIVFARTGGTVGKSFLITSVPEESVFASYLIRLSAYEEILPKFLYYFFQSGAYWEQIGIKKGGLQGNVNATTLASLQLPICSTSEQARIVVKIEELLSALDNGIESLKSVEKQLTNYRRALLKHAFEGKLTAGWRAENKDKLETPDQLLKRVRKEREIRYKRQLEEWQASVRNWESQGKATNKPAKPQIPPLIERLSGNATADLPTLPPNWLWLRLEHVSDISGGLTKNQKRNNLPKRMKYLRVANVYADEVLTDEVYEIGVTDEEARKVALEQGDLLIVEGNGSVDQIGRVAMWGGEIPDCGHQNHLIRARLATNSNPRFFLQFMLSPLGRDSIMKEASSTSGLHTLSITKVSNLIVPVVPPAEEAAVLQQIEEKLSNVDKLLEEIGIQLVRADALRQSILKKAFSGQLVEQDSKDEPASVLLGRMNADRGARSDGNKTNNRKKAA
jgi:type I restriction enzyme S subunit